MNRSPTPAAAALPEAATPARNGVAPAAWSWVPVRSLGPRHRARIFDHLKALHFGDRYLRFGSVATDAQMSKYVDLLDFEQDEMFGIFNRRLALMALAHLAHPVGPLPSDGSGMSEFGVSVLPAVRGRGFGRRLFEHAMLRARSRGVSSLLVHALSENVAMLRIARSAGATAEGHGSKSQGRLKLPPDTLSSHVGEMFEQPAAKVDDRLKGRTCQVDSVLDSQDETRGRFDNVTQL